MAIMNKAGRPHSVWIQFVGTLTAIAVLAQPCPRRCVESPPMRRWLFVLFLFVLPFQFVWASAAPYCAHESYSSAAKHFGHHEHKHAAGGEIKPAGDENNDSAGLDHVDCESCHLGCSPPFSALAPAMGSELRGASLGPRISRYISHIPTGPDRPNRVNLTAAARFGGGVVLDLLIT